MLTKFDDYPIHQTSEPLAVVATSDRHAYDRYWSAPRSIRISGSSIAA